MKNIIATMLFAAITLQTIVAQNNSLIVYSQDGLKFSLILNGIRQNTQPETNVKITGLNAPNYQVKIIFNSKIPDINQNIYLTDGAEKTQNTEYSYSIKNVKENYKLKFNSTAPITEVASAAYIPEQKVYTYTPVERTTQTVTTTTSNTMGGNNASLGVNVNGLNMNINVNDMNSMEGMNGTTTTTSTTTYSSSTTTSGGMGNPGNTYVLPGYNGVYGCPYPMEPGDFESAKASIKSKSFDDSKLTLAKQIIGSNCMLCSQIKELMLLFSFEETRLELAKYAWHHNLDKGNYYKLNDAFTFESSIDELNQYTQSR